MVPLRMPASDILPTQGSETPVVELQPVQGADAVKILRFTSTEPSVTLDPIGVVEPLRRGTCV